MVAVSRPRPMAVDDRILRLVADELQIPEDRAAAATMLYEGVAEWLAAGPFKDDEPTVFPQGSFSYGTTVKPIPREEFDIDAVIKIRTRRQGPSELISDLYEAIKDCPLVTSEPELLNRCVRVKMPGQFHIDFVPAVPSILGGDFLDIPSYVEGTWRWKTVNPRGFTQWFEARCRSSKFAGARQVEPVPDAEPIEVKSDLKIAVQLIKRNHQMFLDGPQSQLRTPSIVQTVLAGHVGATGDVEETMSDVISFLSEIVAFETPPDLRNPANIDEVISEKWAKPEVWAAFRKSAKNLEGQWNEYLLSQGTGFDNSVLILNRMFGESITRNAVTRFGLGTKSVSDSRGLAAQSATRLAPVVIGLGAPRRQYYGAPKPLWG